jgi:hypothetical protein
MESLDSGMLNDPQENSLDSAAKDYLLTASKWARFLAILGLVFVGILVIFAFAAGVIFTNLGTTNPMFENMGKMGPAFTFIYLILAGILFFPAWYLFKFATNAISTLTNSGSGNLTDSFKFLKSCFKFYGIMSIIFIGFYGIVILFALIALAFR